MTQEHVDAEMATDIAMETESVRTAEKFTSITKDTGTVDFLPFNPTFGSLRSRMVKSADFIIC